MRSRLHVYLMLLLVASALMVGLGFYVFLVTEVPSVAALKDLKSIPPSTIYGVNDEVVYLIVPDNKIFVAYGRIPKYVRDAFVAAEDADFFKHKGVDPTGIVRAIWKNIVSGRVVQGGSTITQQVIKSLILGPEKSMLRKVREAILSYRLETYLTKNEILNLYLNHIYMGQGVYGVEAASQVYFGKHVWEISRAEATMLAGLVQAPSRYSPKKHPGLAKMRQEYVIDQMWKKGYIDEKRKNALLKERIPIREDDGLFADSYFKNAVVRYVEDKYGKGIFNRRQLKIYATVDPGLQRLGQEAVKRGLRQYDERRGEYAVSARLDPKKWEGFLRDGERDLQVMPLAAGKTYSLLVTERMADGYAVLLGKQKGLLKMAVFPFEPGSVVKGQYVGLDKRKLHLFAPVKSSGAEGALLCMDVQNGFILAMVGGRDFEKSPYNRAFVAKVQTGSAFKPFIYLAALEKGYDVDSVLQDEPKEYPAGMGKTWVPRNYDGVYRGPIPLYDAIAYSKNAATVRLLEDVGIAQVRHVMEQLGLDIDLENDLSIALGSSNAALVELVKGYSVFASGGLRVKPMFIRRVEDAGGEVLEVNEPQKVQAIPPELAAKMNFLLKGVTRYGTAKEASSLGYPVAGKTGTTSNFYDALFVGYSPHICTGVWAGFDQRTSLGTKESGGRVSLPIWMNFMAGALRKYPADDFPQLGQAPSPVPPSQPSDNPMQPGSKFF